MGARNSRLHGGIASPCADNPPCVLIYPTGQGAIKSVIIKHLLPAATHKKTAAIIKEEGRPLIQLP